MIHNTPVLTGRSDRATIARIFKGWAESEEMQRRFNPSVELIRAREMRDAIMVQFGVRPDQLIGHPRIERHQTAQREMIRTLIRRGWGRRMVEIYLGTNLPRDAWMSLEAESRAAELIHHPGGCEIGSCRDVSDCKRRPRCGDRPKPRARKPEGTSLWGDLTPYFKEIDA